MRKNFAQNLLFALAANGLVKPAYILLIDREVQARAGGEAYGRYAALFNLATIFGVILDFGLAQYATKRMSALPESMSAELGPLLSARLLLCAVYGAAVFIAASLLGFDASALTLLGSILVVQALAQTLLFLRACVASLQRFKADAALSILDRLLLILLFGAVLLSTAGRRGPFWIDWFVLAQIVCYTAAVLTAFFLLRRLSAAPLSVAGTRAQVWAVVRGSVPYAVLIFLMAMYTRVDMLMLERIAGAEQAGEYAAAFRLLDVGNMVGLTVAAILLPLFGRLLAEGKAVGTVVQTGASLLLPLSSAVAVGAMFFGEDVMRALYPDTMHDMRILASLMFVFPALCLSAVYSTLLTATGRLRLMSSIAFTATVVNVCFNLLIIPTYGAVGAAWVAIITQWGAALAYTIAVSKHASLQYSLRWIAVLLLYPLILFGASYLLARLGVKKLPLAACFVGLCAVLVFALRIIKLGEVRRLLQR